MPEKHPTININVRFPAHVVEALKSLAQEDERSLNGEIVWAARMFIAQRDAERKADNRAGQDRPIDAHP